MKAEITYSHFVQIDLKEINQWYKKIDERLWNFFLKEFRLKINYIRENPLASEVKYDLNRIAFLKKFPYAIHYQFYENENRVSVLAIFHTSRNPENWKER